MGCHSLLQRIFPTQGSNPGLQHCRQILYCLSYQNLPSSAKLSQSLNDSRWHSLLRPWHLLRLPWFHIPRAQPWGVQRSCRARCQGTPQFRDPYSSWPDSKAMAPPVYNHWSPPSWTQASVFHVGQTSAWLSHPGVKLPVLSHPWVWGNPWKPSTWKCPDFPEGPPGWPMSLPNGRNPESRGWFLALPLGTTVGETPCVRRVYTAPYYTEVPRKNRDT